MEEPGAFETEPPVGSYEWFQAHPSVRAQGQIALPPLPPLVSWKKLSDLGWRLMRGGWWCPPEQPVWGNRR